MVSQSELRRLLEYDENSPSYFVWKDHYFKSFKGKPAGSLCESKSNWEITVNYQKCIDKHAVWQWYYGDLEDGDLIIPIDDTLEKLYVIDNLKRISMSERLQTNESVRNMDVSEVYYIDHNGDIRYNITYYKGRNLELFAHKKHELVTWYVNPDGYLATTASIFRFSKASHISKHRVVYMLHHGEIREDYVIDHIDRNRLNNDISNLRLVTRASNSRNAKLQKNNTSGITGVHIRGNRWVALVHTQDGKRKSKSYNIKKFGYEQAKILAIEWRNAMIEELNQFHGEHGYTKQHGTKLEV